MRARNTDAGRAVPTAGHHSSALDGLDDTLATTDHEGWRVIRGPSSDDRRSRRRLEHADRLRTRAPGRGGTVGEGRARRARARRCVGKGGGDEKRARAAHTVCFSRDLTSFLPPCRLLLKDSIVRMISFLRGVASDGWAGGRAAGLAGVRWSALGARRSGVAGTTSRPTRARARRGGAWVGVQSRTSCFSWSV